MKTVKTSSLVAQRIGDAVRMELVHQGKPQTALARAIGMDQATLNRRVKGVTAFRTDELQQVADFLGVTVGQLYEGPRRVGIDGGRVADKADGEHVA